MAADAVAGTVSEAPAAGEASRELRELDDALANHADEAIGAADELDIEGEFLTQDQIAQVMADESAAMLDGQPQPAAGATDAVERPPPEVAAEEPPRPAEPAAAAERLEDAPTPPKAATDSPPPSPAEASPPPADAPAPPGPATARPAAEAPAAPAEPKAPPPAAPPAEAVNLAAETTPPRSAGAVEQEAAPKSAKEPAPPKEKESARPPPEGEESPDAAPVAPPLWARWIITLVSWSDWPFHRMPAQAKATVGLIGAATCLTGATVWLLSFLLK